MADIETAAWSETAASNIQPSPDGWPSNSSPLIVYATDREMMGAIKRDWNRRNPTVTSGGSANVQTLTYSTAPTAYVRGQCYCFIAGFSNSGALTLNVNGLGAIAVQIAGNALTGGEIIAGTVVECVYTGSVFAVISGSGYLPLAGGALSGNLTVNGQTIIKGTATNDSAAAGFIGEYISSLIVSPGTTLTTATPANITTISLTAGDWDVSGELWFAIGTGAATQLTGAISSVSTGLPAIGVGIARGMIQTAFQASVLQIIPLISTRVSLASTTTYYLVAQAVFPSGTTTCYGRIGARRER